MKTGRILTILMFAVTGWMSTVAQTQDYPQQTPSEQTQN